MLDAIRRIVQSLRVASRAAEQQVGLSGAQLFVLSTLGERAAWSLGELAERTATHQSSVSVVVGRLVDKGLVLRSAARTDRRRLQLSLSARGRTLLRAAPHAAQERLVMGLTELPPADQKTLARILVALTERAGFVGVPAALFFEDAPGKGKRTRGEGTKKGSAKRP